MTNEPSLAQGRAYIAIPGPSVIPDEVMRAMHRPSPNIYEGEIVKITESVRADLRKVARTKGEVAIYIANGHGAWEAALANVVAPGEKVLVASTGRFGEGWAEMATALGAEVELIDFGLRAAIDPERVADALRADTGRRIKAVMAVHVDTSSSVRNDIAALREALDVTGHPALLMVDCIASLACDRFETDAWGVDVMVAGSQKGLMVPPGLSFVFFSAKAAEVRRRMERVSRYWDWQTRTNPEIFYQYFGGTPPTMHLYGLRQALDMLMDEGMEQVWARHERLAQAVWAACECWAAAGALRINIEDRAQRSRAVTSLRLPDRKGTPLRTWLARQLGLTLGIGLGMSDADDPRGDGYFRLGHMGHLNGHMVMGLLGGVEAGMKALDIPHGTGALSAAAEVIAGR